MGDYIDMREKIKKSFKQLEKFDSITNEYFSKNADYFTSKDSNDEIFEPYIPLIGKNYKKFNILSYATAQNMKRDNKQHKSYCKNKNLMPMRMYYYDDFKKSYDTDGMSFNDVAIGPYEKGIVPALIGLYILAEYGEAIEDLNKVLDSSAVTNYYKFSLNNQKTDIHPDKKFLKYESKLNIVNGYWKYNDKLVEKEIETLKPKHVLTFKGRKVGILNSLSNNIDIEGEFRVICINDPSWILHGARGMLKKGGKWFENCKELMDDTALALIEGYLKQIKNPSSSELNGKNTSYANRLEEVEVYLKHYFIEWSKKEQKCR